MKADLKPGAHVHLMGICGTAMASLAGLLKDQGYKVTGSDQNVYPPMSTQLERLGIPIMEGYKKENLNPRPDLVIVGNVITRNHEEAQALLASDIPYTSLPAALGSLMIADRHSLVVAGTHGKTTTTSLLAWTAQCCGKNPGFLIGGIPKNFDKSFQIPQGDWFVIEGDEYDTAFFDKVPKFIHYRPRSAILTSVEFDHADIYRDLAHVKEAFGMLMERIPDDGLLVYAHGHTNIDDVIGACRARRLSFGIGQGDYQAAQVSEAPEGTSFELVRSPTSSQKALSFGRFQIPQFGTYNVLNAVAVLALSLELGWPEEKVRDALKTFGGVKRRQEVLGTFGGVTLIEDFAHHPTAVRMTVQAVRKRYPQGRLFSVFEARSATSRRKVFQKEYSEAFIGSDEVLLPRPYDQSKIPEDQRFSTEELARDLSAHGVRARAFENVDAIVDAIREETRAGDTVLIMSNGGFDGIYGKMINKLNS